MKTKTSFSFLVLILLVSCTKNTIFQEYKAVANGGWNMDSAYTFSVPVDSMNRSYNIFINVRNDGNYPYQNMWLFIEKNSPDSILTKDTIEFYLADNRGNWLGKGVGSVFEMSVLYQQNYKFSSKGTYQFKIKQAMRDTNLIGINDIGLKIEYIN